jgi:hypothetical protein
MKIGIISDTHDNIEPTKKAINFFEDQEVQTVIHCGDIVAPFTAKLFDKDFEFYAVRGNNDGEWNLQKTIEEFGTWLEEMGKLEFAERTLAIYHGTKPEIVRGLVESGEYDYVLRGHTHKKKINEFNGTIEVNPGGIKLPQQEESFHVVILDLETDDISFHRVKDIE